MVEKKDYKKIEVGFKEVYRRELLSVLKEISVSLNKVVQYMDEIVNTR